MTALTLTRPLASLLFASVLLPVAASAATLDISTTNDAYIRASGSSGTSDQILVGNTTTAGDELRGLVGFDLSNPALEGATINSVTLTFSVYQYDGDNYNKSTNMYLYQTGGFDEDSVSWTNSSTDTPWTTPGGDLDGEALVTKNINAFWAGSTNADYGYDSVTFSSADLNSVVASAIAGSGTVDFIIFADPVTDNEGNPARSIWRFSSSNGTGTAPVLSIDYTPAIPEASTYGLMGGIAILGAAVLMRRRRK